MNRINYHKEEGSKIIQMSRDLINELNYFKQKHPEHSGTFDEI